MANYLDVLSGRFPSLPLLRPLLSVLEVKQAPDTASCLAFLSLSASVFLFLFPPCGPPVVLWDLNMANSPVTSVLPYPRVLYALSRFPIRRIALHPPDSTPCPRRISKFHMRWSRLKASVTPNLASMVCDILKKKKHGKNTANSLRTFDRDYFRGAVILCLQLFNCLQIRART